MSLHVFALYKQTNEILNLSYQTLNEDVERQQILQRLRKCLSQSLIYAVRLLLWGTIEKMVFRKDWDIKRPVNQDDM